MNTEKFLEALSVILSERMGRKVVVSEKRRDVSK